MPVKRLDADKAAIARKWVPFLCGIFKGETVIPGTSVSAAMMTGDPPVSLVNGRTSIDLGWITIHPNEMGLDNYLQFGTIELDSVTLQFPQRMPSIKAIPGGLNLQWGVKKPWVDDTFAKLIGVTIEEINIYPDKAEVILHRAPDYTITW